MEKKEIMMSVKMEDASSLFSNNIPLWSVFDLCQETEEKGSLGFMDLLGVHQDYYNGGGGGGGGAPLLADNNSPSQVTVKECPSNSETQQQPPTTPKSSTTTSASPLSSSVSTTTTVDQAAPLSQHADKLLKAKKTNGKKREREARYAFMTKSEVDHLEDGYRWRKYGQKAVKNSPFPRSYYRCTSGSCNVKKRVERSFTDPTIVVTTYEGQHTHPSPLLMPRSSSSSSSMPQTYFSHQHYLHPHHQQLLFNTFPSLDYPPPPPPSSSQDTTNNNALFPLSDHGLLQDVLPSHMFKQE
ncbi:WRKY transcription factor 23-like [Arachis stenosperma]|uniref:WRKY transcription factor 23-like n=1 Tax=Arachis stenosperma TaxID=217475 RepID=UPI0025AC28B1|nr:WRKY transcription factor 23-like [Arachis stenosperma]